MRGLLMKNKTLVNSILFGIAIAMGVSIVILSFFMSFSCSVNLRYFIIFLAIAIICLALAGVNSVKKD